MLLIYLFISTNLKKVTMLTPICSYVLDDPTEIYPPSHRQIFTSKKHINKHQNITQQHNCNIN